MRWYRLAAEQGHPEAQFRIAAMYHSGRGVPKDYDEAARWVRLAAEQGHVVAQYGLGDMYDQGQGVAEDAVNAYAWLSIAAARSESDADLRASAEERKDAIMKRMTQAQITVAQKRFREYWTRYAVPFQ